MKDELNENTGKVETINKNPTDISNEDLSMVVGGLQDRDIDWSVENESVPVTVDDPCPRCHRHMIRIALSGGKPSFYLCMYEDCGYQYTPSEWIY